MADASIVTKTLIITEKPSVAQDFAKTLDVKSKRDGYFEGNGYIITWAIGHLLELFEPHEYNEAWKKWDLNLLPMLPEKMLYKPNEKTKKQYNVVKLQLQRNDVSKIIVATDAGREGELIARTILNSVPNSLAKNNFRFWTSQALTKEVVLDTLENLKNLTEYDRLYKSGEARQFSDWLVGMNLSRAATKKMGDLFSVGRVQTAVLSLIVDRHRERNCFESKIFWNLKAKFSNEKGIWTGTWFKKTDDEEITRFDSQDEAAKIIELIQSKQGVVESLKKQKKKEAPPLLYSLTDLQRDANVKYGFSAQETLDTAQVLYEKWKCLSYPRSDSKVLGKKNVSMAKNIIDKLSKTYPEIFSGVKNSLISEKNKRVFNDAKLTDHHALMPMMPIPNGASENEKKIYNLVLYRFAAAFCEDCEFEKTELITKIETESFRTRGKVILYPGWKSVYAGEAEISDKDSSSADDENHEQENDDAENDEKSEGKSKSKSKKEEDSDTDEDGNIPKLEKGDKADVSGFDNIEKKTTPPSEYTEATLLKDMSNPSKYIQEDDLKKIYKGDVGLGTQATRAQIIETLILRKYVERKKKNLIATYKGCILIDVLRKFKIASVLAAPHETARWEQRLNEIAYGNSGNVAMADEFLQNTKNFVIQSVKEFKEKPAIDIPICKCPLCGNDIIEGKKGYGCSNWKSGCKFVIWKNLDGFYVPRKVLVNSLINNAKSKVFKKNEKGELVSADFEIVKDGEIYQGKICI